MANCKVVALCNQKGDVAKTMTTANLGIGLLRLLSFDGIGCVVL